MATRQERRQGIHSGHQRYALFGLFAATLISCLSCTTASTRLDAIETGATLYGMLYDGDNQAVPGCQVLLDGVESATTDINGRFMIDYVAYGKHDISFRKSGFENCNLSIEFLSKSQILYARIVSQDGLFLAVRKAIAERKWEEASALLARADSIAVKEPISSFLKATIAYRKGEFESAASLLERLIDIDYREAYVYAFLADIYQYHLDKPQSAIAALKKLLSIREDSEARTRLGKLEDSIRSMELSSPSTE